MAMGRPLPMGPHKREWDGYFDVKDGALVIGKSWKTAFGFFPLNLSLIKLPVLSGAARQRPAFPRGKVGKARTQGRTQQTESETSAPAPYGF